MNSILHIFWDPNPLALDFGVVRVAWYGALWAFSFLFGYQMISYFFKKEGRPAKWLDSLLMYMVPGSVIGARLGECLFYGWDYYSQHPIEILYIHKGGLASHGGAIGIIFVLWLWSRRDPARNMLWVLDRIVIAVALAGVLIRFGNFVNQEIVGAPSNGPMAVVFPKYDQNSEFRARPDDNGIEVSYKTGVQKAAALSVFRTYDDVNLSLVESPWVGASIDKEPWIKLVDQGVKDTCCVTYSLMYNQVLGQGEVPPVDSNDTRKVILQQNISSQYATLEGRWDGDSVRLVFTWGEPSLEGNFNVSFLESYDGKNWKRLKSVDLAKGAQGAKLTSTFAPDQSRPVTYRAALREATDLHYIARHPAQLYEAVCYLFFFIFLFYLYQRQKGKIPRGQLFGLFLILIFTARFFIEFIKENQEAFEEDLTLNMGQLLSIPLVLAGVFFVVRSMQKKIID